MNRTICFISALFASTTSLHAGPVDWPEYSLQISRRVVDRPIECDFAGVSAFSSTAIVDATLIPEEDQTETPEWVIKDRVIEDSVNATSVGFRYTRGVSFAAIIGSTIR